MKGLEASVHGDKIIPNRVRRGRAKAPAILSTVILQIGDDEGCKNHRK